MTVKFCPVTAHHPAMGIDPPAEGPRRFRKGSSIDYPELVREPEPEIVKVNTFLGQERLPNKKTMCDVIDPALHRRKT